MFRASARTFYTLLEAQGSAQTRVAAENITRQIWRRQFSSQQQPLRAISYRPAARAVPRTTISPLRSAARRRFHNTSRLREAAEKEIPKDAPKEKMSLSARLKQLSKEYGWTAVGVYFALSALDFPFFFLLVRFVGTEKIGEIEHYVMSHVEKVVPDVVKEKWTEFRESFKKAEAENIGNNEISEHVEMAGLSVEAAQAANKGQQASLATQLALAYAVHKSFIIFRVPLTAAVLPSVVKVLRSWGWKIGGKTGGAGAQAAKNIR